MNFQILNAHSYHIELLKKAIWSDDIIFITGLPSVGKTTLAKRILDEEKRRVVYVHINCLGIMTPSKLYIDICRALQSKFDIRKFKNKISEHLITCNEFIDFYDEFSQFSQRKGIKKIFIILDQVEVFKRTTLFDHFVVLATSTGMNLMLISNECALDFLDNIKPVTVRLSIQDRISAIMIPTWEKSDLVKVILQEPPKKFQELYEKFVHNVVTIVYPTNTRDIRELRAFCQENFAEFLGFYKAKANELYRRQNRLTSEDPGLDDDDLEEFSITYVGVIMSSFLESLRSRVRNSHMRDCNYAECDKRVVYGTSILIVAAYVAAHTSIADDKKNFVKFQRRKTIRKNEGDKVSKLFTLERLIQIYQGLDSLSKGKSDYEAASWQDLPDSVFKDVQVLEDLGIIAIAIGDGLDSLTKYKISNYVNRQYIDRIAQQVGLNLDHLFGFS